MRHLAPGAAAALLALACSPAWSQAAAESRTVAATCANCHGTTGTTVGAMPSLSGQNKAYIVEQMKQFREGKRPATIMHQIAKGYTDQQLELIAAYFAALQP
jgi:cytochrome c553